MKILTLLILFLAFNTLVWAQATKQDLFSSFILEETESVNSDFTDAQYLSFVPTALEMEQTGRTIWQRSPALAMLSSAAVPGSGQALNGKWGRAAIYLLVEAASIAYYFERNSTARKNERSYRQFADQNWSPMAYAQWLVAYSRANNFNEGMQELNALEILVSGKVPNYASVPQDWIELGSTGLSLVRAVEVKTPFAQTDGTLKSDFSHILQDFGSQQYYELMSKYYQFQPGWKDFYYTDSEMTRTIFDDPAHLYRYSWDRSMITPLFIEGRDRAAEFNNNYRQAGNIITLIMVNHIISAFDAYFTVKLKNSRILTQAGLTPENALSVSWHF